MVDALHDHFDAALGDLEIMVHTAVKPLLEQHPSLLVPACDEQPDLSFATTLAENLVDLPEIIDILALTRALCHLGDRIAWLALLRGPWVGLSWQDLHRIVKNDSHGIIWDLIRKESSAR